MERVDIATLIEAIESKPCIWDKTLECYKNKNEKQRAWETICDTLIENFYELDEPSKQVVDNALKKKWYNVRDYFLKLYKTTGLDINKKKYIYHDQLMFLTKTLQSDSTCDSSLQEEVEIEFPSVDFCQRPSSVNDHNDSYKDQKKRIRIKVPNSPQMEPTEKEIIHIQTKNDDDVSFLESIIPATKKIPEERKMQFRIEVMQLIQKFTSPRSSTTP